MKPSQLHEIVRRSVNRIERDREPVGFRALLECGSSENFLTDLLFIQLCTEGFLGTREYRFSQTVKADILVHAPSELVIESKQLHLKDRGRFAVDNLTKDFLRHDSKETIGVIFSLDERTSTTKQSYDWFNGGNRTTSYSQNDAIKRIQAGFRVVFPQTVEKALVREFEGDGKLQLYAYVVSDPILSFA